MTLNEAFGIVLKTLRHKADISQEELSFRADINRTYLSFLETGKKTPSIETIFKLSSALEIEPDKLIRKVAVKLESHPS